MMRWENLKEGDDLPPVELRPDLGQVIKHCAYGWAFAPFFYDVDAARAMGMPGTLIPGPLKADLICTVLEGWLGEDGFVRQVRAAHRRPDITGRRIIVQGRVARRYEEDGARRADLELVTINENGEPSVRAFAVVEFGKSEAES